MNELLRKKLSVGLALSITKEEYAKIFEKYGEYIESLYFSPPLGEKFQSRKLIEKQYQNPQFEKRLYDVIDLAKNAGIKLDCVLNRPSLNEEDINSSISYIQSLDVDKITCLEKHISIISNEFSDKEIIYSFNNEFRIDNIEKISPSFDTIVVAKGFLRDIEGLSKIIANGFNVKLLVNNGCSFNCGGCAKSADKCFEIFKHNLNQSTIDFLYANQSFFPTELDELLKSIDFDIKSIKISNRTSGYEYLDKCLSSYIEVKEPDDYINESTNNYRLWARTAFFNEYLDDIDLEEVKAIKSKVLSKNV